MRDNGVYYIKADFDGSKLKFSTRTRDPDLAGSIFQEFLKTMVQYKMNGHLAKQSGLITYSMPVQADVRPAESIQIISFKEHYEEYIQTCTLQKLSGPTLKSKQLTLKKLLECGLQYYTDFNQKMINVFVESLKNYSDDTKRKFITEVRAFLNYAIKQEYFTDREYNRLNWPSFKTKARETVITEKDFKTILDYLENKGDSDFRYYLETLYYTASRPSEIIHLKSSDVDFSGGSVKIYQNKVENNKISYIPVDFAQRLKVFAEGKEYLFAGANPQQGPEFYSKKFKKMKIALNLDRNYNLYTVRHTAATDLLNKTGDIELVSRQLGHADIEMTAKHYINRNDGKRKELIRKAYS
jgi:integrase